MDSAEALKVMGMIIAAVYVANRTDLAHPEDRQYAAIKAHSDYMYMIQNVRRGFEGLTYWGW